MTISIDAKLISSLLPQALLCYGCRKNKLIHERRVLHHPHAVVTLAGRKVMAVGGNYSTEALIPLLTEGT